MEPWENSAFRVWVSTVVVIVQVLLRQAYFSDIKGAAFTPYWKTNVLENDLVCWLLHNFHPLSCDISQVLVIGIVL